MHDTSTKQSGGVKDDDDAHACDDGAEASPNLHFAGENQLRVAGGQRDGNERRISPGWRHRIIDVRHGTPIFFSNLVFVTVITQSDGV